MKLGYTNIVEIGGINSWIGETVTGSKNVPLQSIDKVTGMIDNKAAPIFVHGGFIIYKRKILYNHE